VPAVPFGAGFWWPQQLTSLRLCVQGEWRQHSGEAYVNSNVSNLQSIPTIKINL
jgi:hypothetical protein